MWGMAATTETETMFSCELKNHFADKNHVQIWWIYVIFIDMNLKYEFVVIDFVDKFHGAKIA